MNRPLFGMVLLIAAVVSAEEKLAWKAGAASVPVTPASDMWMAGYASRTTPSQGKIHDLFAKALALESNGRRQVIVTLDLISIPRPIRDALEAHAKTRHGLSPEQLMVNCSHTHCGPEIRTTRWSLNGLPAVRLKLAEQYVISLRRKLTKLIDEAIANLKPADVSYCRARCGFAMNRRTPSPTGYRNFPNPNGPVDHDVPVLKVISNGKLQAMMFGYACHNTTLGINKFCGDYAGFAQQYLEQAHPGAVAMFVLGCGGDQNPYPRRTVELAQQHGRSLANSVEAALQTQAEPLRGRLRSAYATAKLEYQKPPSRAELVMKSKSRNKYDRLHAERLLQQLSTEGKLRQEYDCPVQVIKLGDGVTLVALPGETVVDYSLRLKQELQTSERSPAIWVAGYSNDVFAYIPSRRVLLEGGYEAGGAMRYMTTVLQHGPFAANVEQRIVSKVLELDKALSKSP